MYKIKVKLILVEFGSILIFVNLYVLNGNSLKFVDDYVEY